MDLQLLKDRYAAYVCEGPQTDAISREQVLYTPKEKLKPFLAALKNDADYHFDMLSDLTAVDYLFWEDREKRFEIVYNIYSTASRERLFVKTQVCEKDAVVDSVVELWPSADWYEREVFDMFGVRFVGHPNLKRILMYEGFVGHALRKDYPYNKRQPQIGPMN